MKQKSFIRVILLLPVLIFVNLVSGIAQEMPFKENTQANTLKQGLVGLLYDDTHLNRLQSLWYVGNLNSAEIDWPSKKDFSAKLQGLIQFPFSGTVMLSAEADNGILLQIEDNTVLNGWENGRSVQGKIEVKKDHLYPMYIFYRQLNGPSYMRVYWQWEDHPKEIIPQDALSFTPEDEKLMLGVFNESFDLSDADLEFDINSIIDIYKPEDIQPKRDKLIEKIFGQSGFPYTIMPDSVKTAILDEEFKSLSNLKRIDKLTFEMDWGLNSVVYHFIPEKSLNQAVIYHQGHAGKFSNGINTIEAFLGAGYDVIAISMPLKGFNRKPTVNLKHFGKLLVTKHEQISFLVPHSGHPIRYFMDPVAGVVNYLMGHSFDRIIMTGISGGGWTTTLYSALDIRISNSYPVAGSLPLYLRTQDLQHSGTFGDYEQYVPEIYQIVNYLELYILAAYGEKRRHLQILNQYDSCCFGGTGFNTYVDIVEKRIKQLGLGSYDFYLDSSHREHKISDPVLEIILNDLKIK